MTSTVQNLGFLSSVCPACIRPNANKRFTWRSFTLRCTVQGAFKKKRTILPCKMHKSRIRLQLLQQREFLLENFGCWSTLHVYVDFNTAGSIVQSPLFAHFSESLWSFRVNATDHWIWLAWPRLCVQLGDESGFSLLPEYRFFQYKTCQMQSATSLEHACSAAVRVLSMRKPPARICVNQPNSTWPCEDAKLSSFKLL